MLDTGLNRRLVYRYDRVNQLKAVKETHLSNAALVAQYVYGYDEAGSRTSERVNGVGKVGDYNGLNQLTGVQGGNAEVLVSGEVERTWVWNGLQMIEERTGAGETVLKF